MISALTFARRWRPASGIQEFKLSGITLGVNRNTNVGEHFTELNIPQGEDPSGFCLGLALASHHPLADDRGEGPARGRGLHCGLHSAPELTGSTFPHRVISRDRRKAAYITII